jgi:aminoglycoside phosphotransferase (APT) family kinase protein
MAAATGASPHDVIRTVVVQALGDPSVAEIARLTSGASRETWTCVVGGERVVVQRQRRGDVRDMAIEAGLVGAARDAGVPVPEMLAFVAGDDEGDAATMITRHVPGETIARKILRDDAYRSARQRLANDLGRALARVHRIDPSAAAGLVDADPLVALRARLDEIGEPHPAFELAFTWLDQHRPATTASTVVHGDFRLGNVIVDAEGLQAVIDWELAHIGDPMEDLGWLCVPAWRFGSRLPAAGVGTRQQLFAAYGEEAGVVVDPEVVRWWEVSGILRWGIICITQAYTHTSGIVRSHELAAIGRRVCETEHDLFLALDGRW